MSFYATEQDLYNVYGRKNIRIWADAENRNDQAAVEARLDWANKNARTILDSRMYNDRYKTPFTFAPNSPPIINYIASKLAGILLYDTRRVIDNRGATDEVNQHRMDVEKLIARISGGQMRVLDINGVELTPNSLNIPFVVNDDAAQTIGGLGLNYPVYYDSYYRILGACGCR